MCRVFTAAMCCAKARNTSRLRAPIVQSRILLFVFIDRASGVRMWGIQYSTLRTGILQPRLFSDDGSNLEKWKDVKSKRGSGDVGEEGKQGGNDSPACANTYMMWCD